MLELVAPAIEQLCLAFDRHGYNPTPIIDLGVLVVNADGKVTDRERAILLDLFSTLLDTKLTAEVVDHLISASLEVIEAAGDEPRARLVAAILQDCDAVEPGVLVALAVAFASEGFSSAERKVIERIATEAGLSPARLQALVKKAREYVLDENPISVRMSIAPTSGRGDGSPPSTRGGG